MKTLRIFILILILALAASAAATAQVAAPKGEGGHPVFRTRQIVVTETMTPEQRRAYMKRVRNYEKLRRNIRLVYPLAKACSQVLNDVDAKMQETQNERARKKYLKKLEKELFRKYEGRIRKLNITQGKLLIKLIDRECGDSAFGLIDEYKSWGSARFWQLIAGFFGASLKSEYTPEKYPAIEKIVREIEAEKAGGYTITYH